MKHLKHRLYKIGFWLRCHNLIRRDDWFWFCGRLDKLKGDPHV